MKHIQTAVIFLFAIPSGSAFADAVTSRADLGADDNIQWGQFGPPGTVFDTPAEGLSDGGLAFTVDDGDHVLQRADQGDGWGGNFSPGDELIWSGDSAGPIVIDFSTPVFGVGANIQEGNFGPFTGVIEVFDADGNLIERFVREGESNANADGSAIFLGIVSSIPIARATLDVGGSPAINMLGLVTIPAPPSLALLGVLGLIVTRRRR